MIKFYQGKIKFLQLSDYGQPLDKRVVLKIHELVEAGCHTVQQIQKDVQMYVKSHLGIPEEASETRRFCPRPQDIRNHLCNTLQLLS